MNVRLQFTKDSRGENIHERSDMLFEGVGAEMQQVGRSFLERDSLRNHRKRLFIGQALLDAAPGGETLPSPISEPGAEAGGESPPQKTDETPPPTDEASAGEATEAGD